jgi:putative hydrolase of the HAD superfamily
MPIRAVVFDIGGVLQINPRTGWLERWCEGFQMTPDELHARLNSRGLNGSLGTCSESEWWAGLREITGMDDTQVEEFARDLWHEYVGTLNVEVAAYFKSLRPRYKTGILSNSFLGAREKEEALYHFSEMCDLIIYSHEVQLRKPDRRIYALTCERLGVNPHEMLFLDDVEENITAAQALGIHAIQFKDTRQAIADVQARLQAADS